MVVDRFSPVSYTHLDVYKRQVNHISISNKQYSRTLQKSSGGAAIFHQKSLFCIHVLL